MQGITLHCRLVRVLNSSPSLVCAAGALRCCQRLAKDLQVACCAARIGRNCHCLLTGDCQDIMPARADHLVTATKVYTERAQRAAGYNIHYNCTTPVVRLVSWRDREGGPGGRADDDRLARGAWAQMRAALFMSTEDS